jgi:hypothetical protein
LDEIKENKASDQPRLAKQATTTQIRGRSEEEDGTSLYMVFFRRIRVTIQI